MTIDIRQMRYFVAVAEELSFRRAAARLNLSQPPLSMQIRSIESELGVELFRRTRRSVELTQAGQFMLQHVRVTIAQFDQTIELARLAARGEAGRLRIGFTASVPIREEFSHMTRQFRKQYPQVSLEVFHSSTSDQIGMLTAGALDVGFLRLPYLQPFGGGIHITDIWEDRLKLFAAADSEFSTSEEPVRIDSLKDQSFVAFSTQEGSGSFEHVSILCGRAGFVPKVVQRGRDASSILGFVASGIGIAILPDIYARIGVTGWIARPLKISDDRSKVVLACRDKGYSPLVERFIHVATGTACRLA